MTRDGIAMASIGLVSASLLLLPPAALLAFAVLRRRAPRPLRAALPTCLGFIVAVLGATGAGLRWREPLAGCGFVMAAYGAYCFLAAATGLIRWRPGRIAARTVALIPIAAAYVLATLGWLGLAWIVMDLARPSTSSERMAPGVTCELAYWGSAASASGYALHIYEEWPLGLRRQVAVYSVMETEPADPDISCAEAFQRYRATSGR